MSKFKSVLKELKKVSGTLTNHTIDRTPGPKSGKMVERIPTGIKFQQLDGDEVISIENVKPFGYSNILLDTSYYSKKQGKRIESSIPTFCINIELDESTENERVYITMLFRNTTLEEITQELVENHKNGTPLNKSKALYNIINKDNGMSPGEFFEQLENGVSITFAQYKRRGGMNFVDTKYYENNYADDNSNSTDY